MAYNTFVYDYRRVSRLCFGYNESYMGIKANLMMVLHTIEKGLTMPDIKPGFGYEKFKEIYSLVRKLEPIELSSFEVQYSYNLIIEYIDFHNRVGYELAGEMYEILNRLKNFLESHESFKCSDNSKQLKFRSKEFFSNDFSSFAELALMRHSVRNYIEKTIPDSVFERVVEIANAAPSSCNRQPSRIHVIKNKDQIGKVLSLQGGCRGFGEYVSSVIIVTSELSCFFDFQERSQSYINSGFFGMNLIYALREEGIGSCILNWSNTRKKDKLMRDLVPTIKDSEQICYLISCGYTPDEFSVALSKRKPGFELLSITQ